MALAIISRIAGENEETTGDRFTQEIREVRGGVKFRNGWREKGIQDFKTT